MGLAGFYLIRDDVEEALNPAGQYEIGLAIQDRTFNPDGSLPVSGDVDGALLRRQAPGQRQGVAVPERQAGQVPLPRAQRLDLATSTRSRSRTARRSGRSAPTRACCRRPSTRTTLTITPGERADVVIDFAAYAHGTEIMLTNCAPAPFPGRRGSGVIPNVMKFIVSGRRRRTPTRCRPRFGPVTADSRGRRPSRPATSCCARCPDAVHRPARG